MTLGARIEQRLGETGLSQAELARRVGIRQSTVNSLIRGDSRTSRSLLKIARALNTTPAYLSGETDDPSGDSPSLPVLDAESRELFDHFAHLGAADRKALLQIVRTMAGSITNERAIALHDGQATFDGEGN